METSKETDRIIPALITVQAELGIIANSAKNDYTGNAYLTLADILAKAKPVLSAHALLLQQFVDTSAEKITVSTRLYHESGQYFLCGGSAPMVELKGANVMQRIVATTTYLRRVQAETILGLEGYDDDGESSSDPKPRPVAERVPDSDPGEMPETVEGLTTAIETHLLGGMLDDVAVERFNATISNSPRTVPVLKKILQQITSAEARAKSAT